jgi:hypothetical protein
LDFNVRRTSAEHYPFLDLSWRHGQDVEFIDDFTDAINLLCGVQHELFFVKAAGQTAESNLALAGQNGDTPPCSNPYPPDRRGDLISETFICFPRG